MLERPTPRPAGVLGTHGSIVATVRVPSEGRADTSSGSMREVQLVAREVDLDTCSVSVGGHTCGWIHRDGHYYVAYTGTIPGHAHECGHALLWDEAVAMLLSESEAGPNAPAQRAETG